MEKTYFMLDCFLISQKFNKVIPQPEVLIEEDDEQK